MEILKINSYYEVVRARSSSRKGGGEDQKEETKKKKKEDAAKGIDRNEQRRCKRRTRRRRGKRSRRRARGKICSVVAVSLTHFLGSVSPKSHNRAFPNDMAGDTFP